MIWLAFRVECLVIEGDRYPNPHCTDHIGGNPLYTLLPHKIDQYGLLRLKCDPQFLRSKAFHDLCS